jgi:hypothetical protein
MRTRLRSLAPVFVSLLLLAACDKKADDKKTDAKTEKKADDKKVDDKKVDDKKVDDKKVDEPVKPAEVEPANPADVLTIGVAKMTNKEKPDEVIEIAADGTVTAGGETLVKVSKDGKLSKPDGTVIAEVGTDGIVKFDGKPMGLTLVEGGASMTTPDGKTASIRFGEDGKITVDPAPEKAPEMTSEGCTGPAAKTCGLVLMTFLLLGEEVQPTGAAGGVEVGPDPALAPAN